jgi:hypothetical protein
MSPSMTGQDGTSVLFVQHRSWSRFSLHSKCMMLRLHSDARQLLHRYHFPEAHAYGAGGSERVQPVLPELWRCFGSFESCDALSDTWLVGQAIVSC